MENVGIENFILIIIAAGFFIFKSFANRANAEILEEYEPSNDEDEMISGVRGEESQSQGLRQRVSVDDSMQRVPRSASMIEKKTNEIGEMNIAEAVEDFDLRKAVIMSEILQPKHKELS